MDTSKEYIKMCEKAIEIQNDWKCKRGDFYYWEQPDEIRANISILTNESKNVLNCSINTWLPRQDQLQEMVSGGFTYQVLNRLIRFIDRNGKYLRTQFIKSMEQLWLTFVMHEKYNKIWDGKDWIENAK